MTRQIPPTQHRNPLTQNPPPIDLQQFSSTPNPSPTAIPQYALDQLELPAQPVFTPRVTETSTRLTSKLKILRMKCQFQQTQMQFNKPTEKNRMYETVTDGMLKADRPITKQQPRLRGFRGKQQATTGMLFLKHPNPNPTTTQHHHHPHTHQYQSQRDRLNKMIDNASKHFDKSRPQSSRGIRAKSQSKSQCLDEDLPCADTWRKKIPVREMYSETRHKSVDLDSIIRINSGRRENGGGGNNNRVREFPFKTSIEAGFLSLFAER